MSKIYVVGLSRSGTTLLTTILDSHPDISMGYELIPPKLGSLSNIATLIKNAQSSGAVDAREVSKLLPEKIRGSCGVFIKRSARALITPQLLVEELQKFSNQNTDNPKTLSERADLATAIVSRKQQLEGTKNSGFKIPITLIKELRNNSERVSVVAVIRDPRDVFASQLSRKMTISAKTFSSQWKGYAAQIKSYEKTGLIDLVVRYEDIVTNLNLTINIIQEKLKIKKHACMQEFYKSKASVHAPGQKHVNAKELSCDVFDSSINRWQKDITQEDAKSIEQVCKKNMLQYGYATDDSIQEKLYLFHALTYKLKSFIKKHAR